MAYRGIIEIMEDLVVAEKAVLDLTDELEARVGMPREKFIAGARLLMAPAESDMIR